MKRTLLFILGFIIITFISCEYKYIDPIEVDLPTEPVSFLENVEPIFQEKCITCHSSTSPILTTGNAYNSLLNGGYVNTSDPESSVLYKKVLGGHPGGNSLSSEELGIILKWITDGAKND
ncbi:MAG: hypothetical protein JEY96_08295 [Bacteroidales bacterium]|nr:hypothetical protein [Bacteroidales bacterium]